MNSGQYGTLFHILSGLITRATPSLMWHWIYGGASLVVKLKTVAGFCVLRISTTDGADYQLQDTRYKMYI